MDPQPQAPPGERVGAKAQEAVMRGQSPMPPCLTLRARITISTPRSEARFRIVVAGWMGELRAHGRDSLGAVHPRVAVLAMSAEQRPSLPSRSNNSTRLARLTELRTRSFVASGELASIARTQTPRRALEDLGQEA